MAALTVADIMERDAPSVTPETGAEDVVARFKAEDVPALPVVNEGGRLVGIITERDLVIADEEGDLHIPHYIELFGGLIFLESMRNFERRLRKAAATTAADLMTTEPVTIDPDASVREAARIIAERDHNRLPVVAHGRYLGIVTRADVLAALSREE